MLDVLQAIASLATPLIVLLLGLLINRRLEQSKQSYSKETEWHRRWADGFLSRAMVFNDAAEEVALLLFEIGQISGRSPQRDTIEMKEFDRVRLMEKQKLIWTATEKFQRAEWSVRIHLQFAPRNRDAVL